MVIHFQLVRCVYKKKKKKKIGRKLIKGTHYSGKKKKKWFGFSPVSFWVFEVFFNFGSQKVT